VLAQHFQRSRTFRRGSALPVVAILLAVLTGVVAFAVDIGFIATQRTALQRTADAGALAAAAELTPRPGQSINYELAREELRRFVNLNEQLEVLDDDIVFGRYNPAAAAGSRFTANYGTGPANAVRVTLRRDGQANGPLNLFFAPVLGRRNTDVRATATVTVQAGVGLLPEAELLPYTVHRDYYYAATGSVRHGIDLSKITDVYTVRPGQSPLPGGDGVKEIVLFGSEKKAAGNFGSLDIGSASNGTPDLVRQILNGPSAKDFAHKDFAKKVTNGVLYAPNEFGGDTGISTGVKDAFESIVGQRRIIPLYSSVTGNGNNAVYKISEFAGITIVAVDLQGNPKRVIAQPTALFSGKVSPAQPPSGSAAAIVGVYAPPRLVIP
jgi:Flp pilus assembly protein TadG